MRPYDTLTAQGQVRRLRRLAVAVLARYQIPVDQLIFVQRKTNAIFRVMAPYDQQFALRIHPPDRLSAAIIEDELRWLLALRQATDLVIPEPMVARDGALVTTLAGHGVPIAQHCVVFHWLPGRFRNPQSLRPQALEQVGEFIGHLHRHATQYALPIPSPRPPWDGDRLVGSPALLAGLGPWPWLTTYDLGLLRDTAARVQATLSALATGRAAWGMIHADLHPGNMPWQRGRVGAIDFDDCGPGHYLFDLAVALCNWTAGGTDRCRYDAMLTGYTRVHPLSVQHPQVLRVFMAARCARPIMAWIRRTPDLSRPPVRVIEMLAQLRQIVEGAAVG